MPVNTKTNDAKVITSLVDSQYLPDMEGSNYLQLLTHARTFKESHPQRMLLIKILCLFINTYKRPIFQCLNMKTNTRI